MSVDIDEAFELGVLPRFQGAGIHARFLRRLALICGGTAFWLLVACGIVDLIAAESFLWLALLYDCAAALFLLTAAVHSAGVVANWRRQEVILSRDADRMRPTESGAADTQNHDERAGSDQNPEKKANALLKQIAITVGSTAKAIGMEPLQILGLSLVAILAVWGGWTLDLPSGDPGTTASIIGGILLMASFGLLVLERNFSASTPMEWPEAPRLARITRVPLLTLVLSAGFLFASRIGPVWPARLIILVGLLPGIVALEMMFRAILALFRPQLARHEPRLLADSLAADLLQWPPPPLLSLLQDELQTRTGIDLRQVWAFSFIKKALLPVFLFTAAAGWLLTGVREVPMEGRGIYERFGRPEAVLAPGLHIGLPWPFGRMVPVENGVVHELTASLGSSVGNIPSSPAEGPAPASANRLWDVAHDTERAQIIASRENERQNFQVVDLDIRFFYRVGLTDAAALAATYNNTDLPELIRSTAGRVLIHEFASRTLDGVLGEQRAALAREIQMALQTELDRVHSGARLLAVVIEAIHPPAGAANAYHGVQAAEIAAQALVARERGNAARKADEAATNAQIALDKANATAQEIRANAEVASIRADAEVKAYAVAGKTFLLERYFDRLDQGLAQSSILVLDHRLVGGAMPTIDLRNLMPSTEPPVPGQMLQSNQSGNAEGSP